MRDHPKIWICTHAYNAEKTIKRTIESILNQTYENFCYIIRDNGSIDGTYQICDSYAKKDSRIIAVRNEKNNIYLSDNDKSALNMELDCFRGKLLNDNDYSCALDADDEYMPDFFQRALSFGTENQLDVVIGGTEMIMNNSNEIVVSHTFQNDLIIENNKFSDYFKDYHWFMRQQWGKLFKKGMLTGYAEYEAQLFKEELGENANDGLHYGVDTLMATYAFNKARKIGIISGTSHKYYIMPHSNSTVLLPNRVESDWVLYKEAENFLLNKNGEVTATNQSFLSCVYANAVNDTLDVISSAKISCLEKVNQYVRIATHPITQKIFFISLREVVNGRSKLINNAFKCYQENDENIKVQIINIINALSPVCAQSLNIESLSLFVKYPELIKCLIYNDVESLLINILSMIKENKEIKKHDLSLIIKALSSDRVLLKNINDLKFLKKYGDVYMTIWRGQYTSAIDQMSSVLSEKANGVNDTFLELYLTLAAMLQKTDEFLYGKLCSAEYYLKNKNYNKSREALNDLLEMGVEENEEINTIRHELESIGE